MKCFRPRRAVSLVVIFLLVLFIHLGRKISDNSRNLAVPTSPKTTAPSLSSGAPENLGHNPPTSCISLSHHYNTLLRNIQTDWGVYMSHKKLSTVNTFRTLKDTSLAMAEPFQTPGCAFNHKTNYKDSDVFGLKKLKLKAGDVVVDIGAHMGTFAAQVLLLFPGVQIYSFEALPRNYKFMVYNLKVNKMLDNPKFAPNPILMNIAVRGTNETLPVHLAPNHHQHSTSWVPRKGRTQEFYIPSITLPEIFEAFQLQTVALLKVDCKACEYFLIDDIVKYKSRIQSLVGRLNEYDEILVTKKVAERTKEVFCQWHHSTGALKAGEGIDGCDRPLVAARVPWRKPNADALAYHHELEQKSVGLQNAWHCENPVEGTTKQEGKPPPAAVSQMSGVPKFFTFRQQYLTAYSHNYDYQLHLWEMYHRYKWILWNTHTVLCVEDPGVWKAGLHFQQLQDDVYKLKALNLKDGDVVVDVGGAMGLFAVVVALVYPNVKVIVIQPMPRWYQYTWITVRQNNLQDRITILHFALTSTELFTPHINFTFNPYSLKIPRGYPSQTVTMSVPAITVPSLMALFQVNKVALIRLECGGCEYTVLPELHLLYQTGKIGKIVGDMHYCSNMENRDCFTEDIHMKSKEIACGKNSPHNFQCCNPAVVPCPYHTDPPLEILKWEHELDKRAPPLPPSRNISGNASVSHPPPFRLLPSALPKFPIPTTWPNLPSVEILARVYWKEEITLASYLLPSLATFWPNHFGSAVVMFDFENPNDHMVGASISRIPPYPRIIYERLPPDYHNVFGKTMGYIGHLGIGYHQQQYSNFFCDYYSDADVIAVMDSDSILTTVQTPQSWFDSQKRPIVIGAFNAGAGKFKSRAGRWKAATLLAIGKEQYADFMVNFPIRIPRQVFPRCRDHMEKLHNTSFDKVFYQITTCCAEGYSQFNIILNFAWHFMRDSISWAFEDVDHLHAYPVTIRTGSHQTQELQFHHAKVAMYDGYCLSNNNQKQYCPKKTTHQVLVEWKNMPPWAKGKELEDITTSHYKNVSEFGWKAPPEADLYWKEMIPPL